MSSATASEPAERRRQGLRPAQYLGYGAGDAANNLAFSLTSMFLLLYYTDVVGLAATTVGTLFLVVRVFDAFADLFAGRVVDKTNTRWGRFRPFLLFAGIPLLLLNVAVFTVPDLGASGTLVYAYVTYLVVGLVYSLTPKKDRSHSTTGEDAGWYRSPALLGGGVLALTTVLYIIFG